MEKIKLSSAKATFIVILCLLQTFQPLVAGAQGGTGVIKGTVTGDNNQPVAGASVIVQNNQSNFSTGTKTDSSGIFTISVPAGGPYELKFSSIGFELQTLTGYHLKAGDVLTLNQSLKISANSLDNVVVVGYGTQRRAMVTGAIASVNSSMIARSATADATGALQGNVPGAVVVKNVGKPGSGYTINIRGISSFGGSNSPLFVIDGVPTTAGLNDINPADIDKIDILKDASATAVYGSRGAKGVVIISTKRGKAGKTSISYDAYMGVRTPTHLPTMFSGPEYVTFRTQQFLAQGRDTSRNNTGFFTAQQWKNIDTGIFTDWPSLLMNDGIQMNHNVSVSGGDDRTRFSLGAGFLREQGNVKPEDFKRYSFRGSVDRHINEKWDAGISFYISQNLQNQGSFEALRSAYRMPPVVAPYDSTGARVFRGLGGDALTNPLYDQENDIRANRGIRAFGQLYIQPWILFWMKGQEKRQENTAGGWI
jgi:TonB-dependent starch-binding outer membrane protein SusC